MAPPMVAFSTRIIALKGENIVVNSAASDEESEEFFNHSHFIEPSLDRVQLRKHDLKDGPVLRKFMEKHCHMKWHVFQVKKSSDDSCIYCIEQRIRMPAKVFDCLSFLPLPQLSFQ